MTISFYANIKLVGDETSSNVRLHLGAVSKESASVDGNAFASFAEMMTFLRFNENRTQIENELHMKFTLEEFEQRFRRASKEERAYQFNQPPEDPNGLGFEEEWLTGTWLDDEGFSMCTGTWF